MPVYATRRHGDKQNDRICQFRIFENMPTIQFDETASLDNENSMVDSVQPENNRFVNLYRNVDKFCGIPA